MFELRHWVFWSKRRTSGGLTALRDDILTCAAEFFELSVGTSRKFRTLLITILLFCLCLQSFASTFILKQVQLDWFVIKHYCCDIIHMLKVYLNCFDTKIQWLYLFKLVCKCQKCHSDAVNRMNDSIID